MVAKKVLGKPVSHTGASGLEMLHLQFSFLPVLRQQAMAQVLGHCQARLK